MYAELKAKENESHTNVPDSTREEPLSHKLSSQISSTSLATSSLSHPKPGSSLYQSIFTFR